MNENKRDFFISYNETDKQWAEWIAAVLEENGYSCYIQAWDSHSGSNFVLDIQEALMQSERSIAVLSKTYLDSMFCQAEWTSAFTKDPNGEKRSFIPIRVSDIEPKGLFAPIICIDLFGVEEKVAKECLLNGVNIKDIPRNRPSYPGTSKVRFPSSLPFNNLPFSRNSYFTGRDSIFKDICLGFDNGDIISLTQTITGMGGLGKTQTALEYAYRYAHKYDWIWWVTTETEATVLAAYKKFAMEMKLLDKEQQNSKLVIETVLNWMDSHDKWMFIYDNADNINKNVAWWPRNNRGNILITTRNKQNYIGKKVDIVVLEKNESIDFLKKRTRIDDSQNALKLAKRLGFLPLALEQAAAYIEINKITYVEYLSLLEDFGLEVLKEVDCVIDYTIPIEATLNISIEKVNHEYSKQLLYLCAYMASENIGEELFTANAELLPLPLGKMMTNRLDINKVWVQLTRYSILERQDDEKGYSMHRLLQEIVRNKIGNDLQWARYCLLLFSKSYDFEYGDIESQNYFLKLTPHIEVFLNITKTTLTTDEEQEKIAYLYLMGGVGNRYLGNYIRALELLLNASTIFEKILGEEHPNTATAYNEMASVFYYQGNYAEALEYYGYALAIRKKVLGKEHPDTATIYNNMAAVFRIRGDYAEALKYYSYALIIYEKVLGKEHLMTARTYNSMSVVFCEQGDYDKALEYCSFALAIQEKVLGKEHPDTAITYNNMAIVFYNQGNYDKALEYYGYTLAIREKILGKEHPDTATTYNCISVIFHDQGDYDKALEYCDFALATREEILGKEHPNTANAYNNMAIVFHDQSNYAKALEWYVRAYRIYLSKLGLEHPNTKKVLGSITQAYDLSDNTMDLGKWLEEQLLETLIKTK